jgi:hypothetical protein
LVHSIGQALSAGATRGHAVSKYMQEGHRANVLGTMRHFHMNETFSDALQLMQVKAPPLQGNNVVVGEIGPVRIGRFNLSQGIWNNARRSKSRRVMAMANAAVEANFYGDLFGAPPEVKTISVFFVAVFSGSKHVSPEAPMSIEIAVPAQDMKSWLFRENIVAFLDRYTVIEDKKEQVDLAMPKLRIVITDEKKTDDDAAV